ncbi:hypothetical protein EGR_00741 [Echinococcus granulosus]|uniref:Uncharacterized protein n=1 Tax=Echinococcus granulosus TaxID=6210 RepID=W6V046_ECHGR|nr:hypothetical protein EGR_00741 [Echinococcus granulosus]EUB64197.1 hypothetical protein EGR_00741 [Echinococcus granulosus]
MTPAWHGYEINERGQQVWVVKGFQDGGSEDFVLWYIETVAGQQLSHLASGEAAAKTTVLRARAQRTETTSDCCILVVVKQVISSVTASYGMLSTVSAPLCGPELKHLASQLTHAVVFMCPSSLRGSPSPCAAHYCLETRNISYVI